MVWGVFLCGPFTGAGGSAESPGGPVREQLLHGCPPVYRRREELLGAVTRQHGRYVLNDTGAFKSRDFKKEL